MDDSTLHLNFRAINDTIKAHDREAARNFKFVKRFVVLTAGISVSTGILIGGIFWAAMTSVGVF